MISSKDQLEKAALDYGLLPFFSNRITGFSVEEMAAPGMLFGEESDDYGCWEWKGPVIREQTTAYGKFSGEKPGSYHSPYSPISSTTADTPIPYHPDQPKR